MVNRPQVRGSDSRKGPDGLLTVGATKVEFPTGHVHGGIRWSGDLEGFGHQPATSRWITAS